MIYFYCVRIPHLQLLLDLHFSFFWGGRKRVGLAMSNISFSIATLVFILTLTDLHLHFFGLVFVDDRLSPDINQH